MAGFGKFSSAIALLLAAQAATAAPFILNEYNAVAKNNYLDAGSYKNSNKEDAWFAQVALGDPHLIDGRIEGNGGNWVELVVVQDHLNLRGWQLKWAEAGASDVDPGIGNIWFGDPTVEQGVLTFSPTAEIWADVRSGTIITVSQSPDIEVDTDVEADGDRNFTRGLDAGDPEVDMVIDMTTDTSYDPVGGDWWIHVSTKGELAAFEANNQHDRLIVAVTNVQDDDPGDFSVGDQDWQMRIFDANGVLKFGPVGEDIHGWGGGGVNDEEVGKLQADPSGAIGVGDYEDGTTSTLGMPNVWSGGQQWQDFSALRAWVPEPTTLLLLGAALPAGLRRRHRRD